MSNSKTDAGPLQFTVGVNGTPPVEFRPQPPRVGAIVLYENNGSTPLPAIVTVVHSASIVDLCVFMQAGFSFRLQVPLIGTGGGADPGLWAWPPRA